MIDPRPPAEISFKSLWRKGVKGRGFSNGVTATHVMALLGNQQQEVHMVSQQPDPIAIRSLENLVELASMMNCN